ncbi:MAG: TonB-dependent receptor [Bryobacteraceae bacterium]|nr:TonB-dependent receptor [Bryobacteraceae bacterium]
MPPVTFAQTDSGSIRVAVVDATDAIVAGAQVELTNTGTNTRSSALSTSDGYAVFSPVVRGAYTVRVEMAGFRSVDTSDVVVNVNERRLVRVKLDVASTTEVMQVTAAHAAIQSEDGSLGQVVQGEVGVELPLAARRYTELALLAPGVTESTLTAETRGPGWFVANGNYHTQNNFLIDGADNNQGTTNAQSLSAQVTQPSPDSISEFKVQTNSFSAEFGRSAGAVVNVSIKSGSNQLHGSAWYYNRDAEFAATSWRANLIASGKDDLSWHQYGGTLGGPVKKNKIFYFADYEGFRRNFSSPFIVNIPTAAQKTGVFNFNVTDPITKVPYPDRTIPTTAFDPLGRKLLDLYPAPNLAGRLSGSRNIENYGVARAGRENTHKGNVRGDYFLSSRNTISLRYSRLRQRIQRDQLFPGLADGEGNQGAQFNENHSSGASWTSNITPTLVNVARFAANKTFAAFSHATANDITAEAFGFRGIPEEMKKVGGLPLISVSNYRQIGTRNFRPQSQEPLLIQIADSVTLIRGKHSARAGFELRAKDNRFIDITRRTPAYSFTGVFTGDSISDLLTGAPLNLVVNTVPEIQQRQQAWSGFFQDDWKISRNLTINLGIRYEYATPYYGAGKNKNINFDPKTGGLIMASDADKYTVTPDRNNFGPRVGAAWQLLPGKAVLRGGFGMFYSGEDIYGSESNLPLNPTQLIQPTLERIGNGPPPLRLSEAIPAGILSNYDSRTVQLRTRERDQKGATIYQYNVALQFLLPQAFTLETAYVGNIGRNLFALWERNQTPFGVDGTVAANRPYPQWRTIQTGASRAQSRYNALQVKLERRYRKGIFLLASYTWASAMDEAGAWDAGGSVQIRDNFRLERGPQSQTARHRLSLSGIYQLPFGRTMPKLARAIAGGWQIGHIGTVRTGLPVNVSLPTSGVDPNTGVRFTFLGRNGGSLRPDRVGDPQTGIDPNEDRFNFLNPAAFRAQANNTHGNSSRNVAIGPGLWNVDLNLVKRFRITERYSAELRADVFNILNHTNFRNPGASFTSTTFGVIDNAFDPRVMQMSFRVRF